MARTCAFCGGKPVTREHGWPQWLEKVFPNTTIKQTVIPDDFVPRDRGIRRSIAGGEVRGVCKSCNSGWMSQLEAASMPLIGPMVFGQGTPLDKEAQGTVATWVLKTCLVHLLTHPAKPWQRFAGVYKDFFETRLPSGRHHVSVAAFTGEKWPTLFHYQPLLAAPSGKPPPSTDAVNGHVLTIVVGHFMAQAFFIEVNYRIEFGTKQRAVWPHRGDFIWPPGPFVNAAELEVIAKTMFPAVDSHPKYSMSQWKELT